MNPDMHNDLIIFTDGASRGNPGPGGYGAIIFFPKLEEVIELGGAKPTTTNNEMELQAIIAALAYSVHNQAPTHIYTDSSYVMNGATKWTIGWKKNGWQTKDGNPVKNRTLWEDLDRLLTERKSFTKVTWHHVPGHFGIPGNERADAIATDFADGKDAQLYRGHLGQYPNTDIIKIPSDFELTKARLEKKESKNKKAYKYVSMVDGEIQTHDTWTETKARVDGKKARFKKVYNEDELQTLIREWQHGE